MAASLVSVVMAVRNGELDVLPSITSVLEQSMGDLELIIVDDGSTDRTLQLVRQMRDPRILLVANRCNLGLAASLNKGVDLARSPYVARMDADDISFPLRLERQVEHLERHSEVDLTGTGVVRVLSDGTMCGHMLLTTEHDEIIRRGLLGSFPLYHPTWLGRLEWFRQHAYDPAFTKSQDYELLLRAHLTSRFSNVPEVLLGYRYDFQQSRGKRLRSRMHTMRAMTKILSGKSLIAGLALTAAKAGADALLPSQVLTNIAGNAQTRQPDLGTCSADDWHRVWQQTLAAIPKYLNTESETCVA